MLTKLLIRNFKCFKELDMDLKAVNIFTGLNGMGKSTALQSILVLRQSYEIDSKLHNLYYNGKYVGLGTGQDVLYEKAENDIVELAYETDLNTGRQLLYKSNREQDKACFSGYHMLVGEDVWLTNNRFVYLSANRITPSLESVFPITDIGVLERGDWGVRGEYTPQYISVYGNDVVENEYVKDGETKGTLYAVIRYWLDKVSPGISPVVRLDEQLRMTELRYEYREGRVKTNAYRSYNTGFGVTYILPVIVALVSAKRGDSVIVENPEAHIHPAGQTALGKLISLVGKGGVQVFIETHSDHIINGVRMAVKDRIVDSNDVKIAYFYKDTKENYEHKVSFPEIRVDGGLTFWPDGFLDEWSNALYRLM